MRYPGKVEVLMSSEVKILEQEIFVAVLHLAKGEACNLAAYPISSESPLALLAEVQVCKQLTDNLQPFFEAVKYNQGETMVESGLVLAFDDHDPNARRIIGFIDFIPRLFTPSADSTASVGSIVVAHSHRGRGVMRAMLTALQALYCVHVLDCSVELAPIYKHLGYSPVEPTAGGTNVSMSNGVAKGEAWEPPRGLKYKQLIEDAIDSIREKIGSDQYDMAWRDLKAENEKQKLKVVEFFAGLSPQ